MYLSVLLALYYKGLLIFFLCRKGQILSCLMFPVDFYVMWNGAKTYKFVALRYRFMWNTLKAFHFGRFTFIMKTTVWFRKRGKKKNQPQNHRTWHSGDALWLLWLICIKSTLLTVLNSNLKNLLHGSKRGAVLRELVLQGEGGAGSLCLTLGAQSGEWSCFVFALPQTGSKWI